MNFIRVQIKPLYGTVCKRVTRNNVILSTPRYTSTLRKIISWQSQSDNPSAISNKLYVQQKSQFHTRSSRVQQLLYNLSIDHSLLPVDKKSIQPQLRQQQRHLSSNHKNGSNDSPTETVNHNLKSLTNNSEIESSSSISSTESPLLAVPDHLNAAEKTIYQHLAQELKPDYLNVQDISGGCGSMYAIEIVSHRFTGMTMVNQQKLVYASLRDMVKNWHGLRLKTSPP